MSTAAYPPRPSRPDMSDADLLALVERVRLKQARRTPQEARRMTLAALRRWKASPCRLRDFTRREA